MKVKMINKKGLGPIVATSLLIVVAVIATIAFQGWFTDFESGLTTEVEKQSMNTQLRVDGIFGDTLYIYSGDETVLSSLKIVDNSGNEMCSFSGDGIVNDTGLVGWWTLDDEDSLIKDKSGNENHGTLYGTTRLLMDFNEENFNGTHVLDRTGYKNHAKINSEPFSNFGAELGNNLYYERMRQIGISTDSNSGSYSFDVLGYLSTMRSLGTLEVDFDKTYEISGWFKSIGSINSRLYYGFSPYDKNMRFINNYHVNVIGGSETIIYEDVFAQNNIVKVENCNNWITLSHARIALNVDDSDNYNDLPNFNLSNSNIIRVENVGNYCEVEFGDIVGINISAGTKVRQHISGWTYHYTAALNSLIPNDWRYYSGEISGELLAGNSNNVWRRGTEYAKLLLLINYNQDENARLLFDDLKITADGVEVTPLSTTPTFTTDNCVSGGCLDFNGISNYLEVKDFNGDFLNGERSFSFSFWTNTRDELINPVFSTINSAFEIINGDRLRFFFIGENKTNQMMLEYNFTNNIVDSWNHYSIMYDKETNYFNLYLNGDSIAQIEADLEKFDLPIDYLLIGSSTYAHLDHLNGLIDEFSIYSKALTDVEVKDLYESQKAKFIEFKDSKLGKAVEFDGVDNYIEISHSDSLNITPSITIVSVFNLKKLNTEDIQGNFIVSKRNDVDANRLSFYIVDENQSPGFGGSVIFNFRNSLGWNSWSSNKNIISENKWTFFSSTYDSSFDASLYHQGHKINSQISGGSISNISTNDRPFIIGGYMSGQNLFGTFDGKIDEVRIYNRTLTEEEIKDLYWYSIRNNQAGVNQLDISSCNLNKGETYNIVGFTNNQKVEGVTIKK